MSDAISLAQVEAAQPIVYQHMRPTPLIHYPLLSQETGFQAYVKHENHTPIGAFKIRGGLNILAHLARQGVPGVITATRGNHGQSVALAARLYHIPATITVLKALRPAVRIVGVQAENAPAVYNSWSSGQMCESESAHTFADGLATRVAFEMPFRIMQEGLDAMVLVSEDDIRQAIVRLWRTTHNLAEGAGAASLAAAWKLRESLAGQKVVLVLSGGNMDMETLRWVLS